MWDRMQQDGLIVPRRVRRGETHMEVYLPEQVAVVFDDSTPRLVTHISTGSGEEWCEEVTIDPGQYGNENGTEPLVKGVCGRSETPGGIYQFNRRFEGWREGQLGRMHNPVYFNYGVAVHGASNVPLRPASHGCVRIPMHISEYFPTLVSRGDVIYVFDGKKEPEAYGAQPPPFNWPDPSWTTTTTTTSTTTTTTVAPTTTKPAATTTTKPPTPTPTTMAAPVTTAAATTVPETTAAAANG
jgi:hypothetical protein